jgi:transglutaminase-like putative cysteine protease
MTSRLVTPWWADRRATTGESDVLGSTEPTRLLDWDSPLLRELTAQVESASSIEMVQQAHQLIAKNIRPVYAVDDSQPASKALALGRGSCSQRLSVLEAVARSLGIATRVRGLMIDGKFWYPRFPRMRFAVPNAVVLAWPEFLIEDSWVSASEIFGTNRTLNGSSGFTNTESPRVSWRLN